MVRSFGDPEPEPQQPPMQVVTPTVQALIVPVMDAAGLAVVAGQVQAAIRKAVVAGFREALAEVDRDGGGG